MILINNCQLSYNNCYLIPLGELIGNRKRLRIISSETIRKENGKRNNYYLDKRINVVVVEPKNDSIFDNVVKLIYWHIGVPNCGFCRKILNRIYYPNEYLNIWTDRKNMEWKLKIIGGGRLEGQLISQIKKLGLSEVVSITGYTDNVKEKLLAGSIFCMTSRWEGFPMTITEALEEIANSDKIRMSMSLAAIEKAKLLKPEAIYEKWDVLFKKVMSE